jgi:DNA replication protein DnaC
MIKDLLTSLKMKGALEVLKDAEHLKGRDEFVAALLKAEIESKELRSNKRRLSQAKFPTEKEWRDLDPTLNPSIEFSKIESLNNGLFIQKKENICLMGHQGTGKTHSLIALGRELCRKGKTVRFYTASALVNALEEAKSNHILTKLMQSIGKIDLLIIDELGFVPLSENQARLLFDVFASRYEKGSIAVSTNLSFDKWVRVFVSPELTAALVDRFTHKCLIHNFQGQSVRLLGAKKRQEKLKLAS